MSGELTHPPLAVAHRPAIVFATVVGAVMLSALVLAGTLPISFSIVTVFLFAGPHNWLEARYMLARMPARWGSLRPFFLTGIAGVIGLTIAFAALPFVMTAAEAGHDTWLSAVATWNTLLVAWIATLVQLRARQNPRRSWPWVWPVALAAAGANWLAPLGWSLVLVYVHPLLAMWFLDRELARQRPEWQAGYRACLAVLPVLLGVLWWQLAGRPDLIGAGLTERIVRHAGAGVLDGISTHLLVATHTFLEMLHYGVWLVAIPLVSVGRPWQIDAVPLARRSTAWRRVVTAVFVSGGAITLGLWCCFLADYPLTRDVYFTVALLHVLAEVPFLLRLL